MAIANEKGGVGKTVVTMQCAHAAVDAGYRALYVEADPQGNATLALTEFDIDTPPPVSLADVIDRNTDAELMDAVIPTEREGLYLLSAGFDELQAVQDGLIGKPGAENSIKRALKAADGTFDFVFLDTRPARDLITRNAFMAADAVMIVVQPERFSSSGLNGTLRVIAELREYLDKELPMAGWVVNMIDGRRADHAEHVEFLRQRAIQEGTTILAELAHNADLSKLTISGMGLSEHNRPTARIRSFAQDFDKIIERLLESVPEGVSA
ncbi:hypothetical protein A7R75_28890 [Mycolicibacterium llatzerense]|nr:hypothetical protein [Mycolicibacterium llatzerense]